MSEKAETRAVQSAKDSRATTAKVANVESRVAWLEQDAPEPMPVLPKQAERVEQQDGIIPQPWQVRAFDTTDRTDVDNVEYKAVFQIYNPVLFFGGVPKPVSGGGTGWSTLYDKTPLSSSLDVVCRVTYIVDAEGERSFKSAEVVVKNPDEKPKAEEGEAIDDIEIATLHDSGWSAITQRQTGPIYLGGGGSGGGGGLPDGTEIPGAIGLAKYGEEIWLVQSWKRWSSAKGEFEDVKKKETDVPPENSGGSTDTNSDASDPIKIVRLDEWMHIMKASLSQDSYPKVGEKGYLNAVHPLWDGISDDPYAPTADFAPEWSEDNVKEQDHVLTFEVAKTANWNIDENVTFLDSVPAYTITAGGYSTHQAALRNLTFVSDVGYTPPVSELVRGALSSQASYVTVLSSTEVQRGEKKDLLYTEVAPANDSTSYEDSTPEEEGGSS